MSFQIALPNSGPARDLADLAVLAESLNFTHAWVAEHVLPPQRHPDPSYDSVFDPFVLLSYVAAVTTTIRLGTSVLVLPLRNPYVVAKQAASLDEASRGRFDLGIGVGWDAEEFASVGAEFGNRGKRADEQVALLRHLWSGAETGFLGRFHGHERADFTPVRPDGIPITVGGNSKAARERAIRLGDAWQPFYSDGNGLGVDAFARAAADVKDRTAGRVRTAVKLYVRDTDQVDALARETPDWLAAGADDIVIWFGEIDGYADRLTRFADTVAVTA